MEASIAFGRGAVRRRPVLGRLTGYVRGLDPHASKQVWALQAGGVVNSAGTGLVYPFVAIYLHNVRGLSLGMCGLVIATFGAVTFAVTPVAGAFVDRCGARAALGGSLAVLALGYGLFPLVRTPAAAFACMCAAGLGNGGFWPAVTALMMNHTRAEDRAAAFSLQRMGQNLGMAIGGVAGGLIATTSNAASFSLLFTLDAASFVAFAAVLPFLGGGAEAPARRATGGYRAVARDGTFVRLVGLNVIVVAAAYAPFETVLPVFAKNDASVGERAIGLLYFVNMALVVAAQLPVTKLVSGRRRMPALSLAAWLCAAAFAVVLAAGSLAATPAAMVLVLAAVVFTGGELLHGPTQSALVADLAPPELRGRYFSLVTCSYALGFTVGPAVGGFVLAASSSGFWFAGLGVLVVAGAALRRLEGRVPAPLRVAPRPA